MESVEVKRTQITPEIAKSLLERNGINRHKSDKIVNVYAQQMRGGEWMETADTIKISPEGDLLDGQHRLNAVIVYGKPVWMWVAKNVDKESFVVMDTGKRRSTSDMVAIAGHKYATGMAAVARMILGTPDGRYSKDKGGYVSNTKILEFISTTPELSDIVAYAYNILDRTPFKIGAGLLGSMYWHMSRKSVAKADEFMELLADGVDMGREHPVRLLRERLMKDFLNKSRLKGYEKAALFVYAWNAFRQKKELTTLLLPKTGDFPKMI